MMHIIGKTFAAAPILNADEILINVYECEECHHRQTQQHGNLCLNCPKLKKELREESIKDDIRNDNNHE